MDLGVLIPVGVGWLGGLITAGIGAYVNHRMALTREREARRVAALRERYDKGQTAIQLWVNATEDLNRWQTDVAAGDGGDLFAALAEVFGRDFASEAVNFIDKDDVFDRQDACYQAMMQRQEELAAQLGLPPVLDLQPEQARLLEDERRESAERLGRAEERASRQRVDEKSPAPAATDAGQDTGGIDSDDVEEDTEQAEQEQRR